MHFPKLFKSEDFNLLKEIIRENSFSSLITYKEKILSTKAMMQLNELGNDLFLIETHINRANPVARKIKEGDEVLCDFLGAHSYISSSWYDHINVSTWNYEEVQIYGLVEIMSDNELYNHLKKLTDFFELPQKCPMTLERMGTEFVEKEMRGALGIKIIPTDVKVKRKLSQNRDEVNYQRIIENLNESNFQMDKIMAKKMTDLKK
ncbi:FMN-binding negative transcriptional regulator [Sphingobacterium lumbrici]|uniref:FMN-binding negative transcriptional regulator n=1 Tax=Sphingobacterium lumbrici TaxID=2559600 RepID=UPI00112A4F27|nr:FMN-binding negative transcriptional regulator [Sphingobacterium lumbrici]